MWSCEAGRVVDRGGETAMKQVLVFCKHCGHRINFHDLFQRYGTAFYHALCWELHLLECTEHVSAVQQEQTHDSGPQSPPSP